MIKLHLKSQRASRIRQVRATLVRIQEQWQYQRTCPSLLTVPPGVPISPRHFSSFAVKLILISKWSMTQGCGKEQPHSSWPGSWVHHPLILREPRALSCVLLHRLLPVWVSASRTVQEEAGDFLWPLTMGLCHTWPWAYRLQVRNREFQETSRL